MSYWPVFCRTPARSDFRGAARCALLESMCAAHVAGAMQGVSRATENQNKLNRKTLSREA